MLFLQGIFVFSSRITANFAGFPQGSVKLCVYLGVRQIRGPQRGGGGGEAVVKCNGPIIMGVWNDDGGGDGVIMIMIMMMLIVTMKMMARHYVKMFIFQHLNPVRIYSWFNWVWANDEFSFRRWVRLGLKCLWLKKCEMQIPITPRLVGTCPLVNWRFCDCLIAVQLVKQQFMFLTQEKSWFAWLRPFAIRPQFLVCLQP